MRKVLAWVLRFLCIILIGLAVYTIIVCVQHMNDDHSYETVMAAEKVGSDNVLDLPLVINNVPEDTVAVDPPLVSLSIDGPATAEDPVVEITAAFSGIESSLDSTLMWYLDGKLQNRGDNYLLVDGTSITYGIQVDVENAEATEATAELVVEYPGGSVSQDITFVIVKPDERQIQTLESIVVCIVDCSIYSDENFRKDTGRIMRVGQTGILLDYHEGTLDSMYLQFTDGTTGWVSARRNQITQSTEISEEDYTQEQKENFVNTQGYSSDSRYLIWVNLYTQKVNVFRGSEGAWRLETSFPCSTGATTSPTEVGVYSLSSLTGRRNVDKDTYVEPVLTFNGSDAFTCLPKYTANDLVVENTIGTPASDGCVWMLTDDVEWLSETMYIGTAVVVY